MMYTTKGCKWKASKEKQSIITKVLYKYYSIKEDYYDNKIDKLSDKFMETHKLKYADKALIYLHKAAANNLKLIVLIK